MGWRPEVQQVRRDLWKIRFLWLSIGIQLGGLPNSTHTYLQRLGKTLVAQIDLLKAVFRQYLTNELIIYLTI